MSLIALPQLTFVALFALPPSAGAQRVDFARDIRPIFEQHCFRCHGPKEEEAGLRLDVRAAAMAGGTSGPVIVPGKAAESLLWQFITGRNEDRVIMPPKDRGARLTESQCQLVARWIDEGAVWSEPSPPMAPAAGVPAGGRRCRGFFLRRRR